MCDLSVRRWARRSLLSLVPVLLLPLAACPPPPSFCECFVCESAVTLTVTDVEGRTVDTFVVEQVVNDQPLGEPDECAVENREGNSCAFGQDVGLYHIIVSAPGFASREAVVRVADQSGGEICCQACLRGKELTVELEPL